MKTAALIALGLAIILGLLTLSTCSPKPVRPGVEVKPTVVVLPPVKVPAQQPAPAKPVVEPVKAPVAPKTTKKSSVAPKTHRAPVCPSLSGDDND